GAGIAEEFLALVRAALAHYGISSLAHDAALARALMRLFATQQAPGRGGPRDPEPAREDALPRIAGMRALVGDALADAAIEARAETFLDAGAPGEPSAPRGDAGLHGLDPETAAR